MNGEMAGPERVLHLYLVFRISYLKETLWQKNTTSWFWGGPGGYVAAIRAAQLGLKTAVVEAVHGRRASTSAAFPPKPC